MEKLLLYIPRITERALWPKCEKASMNSLSWPGAFRFVFLMTDKSSCISNGWRTLGKVKGSDVRDAEGATG